jgi:hypothetical protein
MELLDFSAKATCLFLGHHRDLPINISKFLLHCLKIRQAKLSFIPDLNPHFLICPGTAMGKL